MRSTVEVSSNFSAVHKVLCQDLMCFVDGSSISSSMSVGKGLSLAPMSISIIIKYLIFLHLSLAQSQISSMKTKDFIDVVWASLSMEIRLAPREACHKW